MDFETALQGVQPYDRIALYNSANARIVNFNNPVATKNKKTAKAQIQTIQKIVTTLPPGKYSLAGKAPGSSVEPVFFSFEIEGEVLEPEIVSAPTFAQGIADAGGADLYKKIEELQRQLLEAKLQAQEAHIRAELQERRIEELHEQLEIAEDHAAVEPMAENPSIWEQIVGTAAPILIKHFTGNLSEGTPEIPGEAILNAQQGQELLQKRQAQGLDCNNIVGRERAQQLVNVEELTEEDIQEFKSYLNRAQTYYNEDQRDCGTISYLLWGGDAMKNYVNSL